MKEEAKEYDCTCRTIGMLPELLSEYELIVDSWEQPRERPEDNQIQKEYYSVKKRMRSGRVTRFVTS